MDRRAATLLAVVALIIAPRVLPAQTLAKLAHEATPDIPDSRLTQNAPRLRSGNAPGLRESALSRSAAEALFVASDVQRARALAARALRRDPQDAEALFVRMELAGIEADDGAMLDTALRLCEVGDNARSDPRVQLAARRIRESAANTQEFRKLIPRLQSLLGNLQAGWLDLNEALLSAAMDGVPGLDPYAAARAAGILTDWRIVGPLGLHPLLDQQPVSPTEDLARPSYQNRLVENFQFPDGRIVLPEYLSHRGLFYAASSFASFSAESWTIHVESAGAVEIYADGKKVLKTNAERSSADFNVAAGPHHVLLKFVASATPMRISVSPALPASDWAPRAKTSLQELTYLLAAQHYAADEFGAAVKQIAGVPSSNKSAALDFLLGQSCMRISPTMSDCPTSWYKLRALVPHALAADRALGKLAAARNDFATAIAFANTVIAARPSDAVALQTLTAVSDHDPLADVSSERANLWSRLIAVHPSCAVARKAIVFYRENARAADLRSAEQKLEGCSPESLDYARALSADGDHAGATASLQKLLAAAPLNRAAREMLVRELQLSGDDTAAQQAAAEWLRIAPNAEDYHRLAADAVATGQEGRNISASDFFEPYRRDAVSVIRNNALPASSADMLVLLNDHVAAERPDGSVSLYIHIARRVLTATAAQRFASVSIPQGAQVLTSRVVHSDGTATAVDRVSLPRTTALVPGDTVDQEYVLHYSGDGGIPEHAEAFQFVFGSFGEQVLRSRFVVLVPAGRADHGVVIVTGKSPVMTEAVRNGMLERVWDDAAPEVRLGAVSPAGGLAIVRVVEQENGWSVPSGAEHQRRIETIHPGPRSEDS